MPLLTAAFLAFAGLQTAQAVSVSIYAGQHAYVGEAVAFTDSTSLYIYVFIEPDWKVTDIHFQPVSSVSEFPVNAKGNPKIGQFAYTELDFSVVNMFGSSALYLKVPRASLPNPQSPTVCAAFHAVVSPASGSVRSRGSQTAWAGGTEFTPGGSWATYFCISGGAHED